jgi:chromosomal replication initiation ATPase DnaA
VDKRGSTIASRAAAEELWARVGAAVRQQLNDRTWDIWFQGVRALELADDCLTLAVPNPMAAERIRSSYAGMLDDAALALTGLELRFDLVVQSDGGRDDGDDCEARVGAADPGVRRRSGLHLLHLLHRRRGGGQEAISHSSSSMRWRTYPESRSGAMPKPEWSRLRPPMKCTGQLPSTARRTSSIIWPWLFS